MSDADIKTLLRGLCDCLIAQQQILAQFAVSNEAVLRALKEKYLADHEDFLSMYERNLSITENGPLGQKNREVLERLSELQSQVAGLR